MKIIDENTQKRADIIQKFNDETYRNYFFEQSLKYKDDRLKLWLRDIYDRKKEYFEFNEYIHCFTSFLKEVAIQNVDNKDEEIENILLTSVDNFLKSQSVYEKNGYDFGNIFDILFKLDIKYITCERIEKFFSYLFDSDFSLILVSYAFNFLIANNLSKQVKLVLEAMLKYYEIKQSNCFIMKEIFTKYSSSLIEILGSDLKQILENYINEIYKKDKMAFSIFRIQSIENLDQSVNEIYSDEYEILLIWFYKELILSIADTNLIEANLKKKNPIYRRIAFYIINLHYDDYKGIFWEWFKNNLISEKYLYFRHEFYFILQNNYTKFSDDELKCLTDDIEKSNFSYDKKYSDKDKKAMEAWRKKEWLWAIKDANDNIKQMYEKYDNIAPGEIANPGFDFYTTLDTEPIPEKISSDNKFDFKNKELKEILEILNDKNNLEVIKESDIDWYFRDKPQEYLAKLLCGDIKSNFKKYESNFSYLSNLQCIYIYNVIIEIYNNLEQIQNMESILNFIDKVIDEKRYEDMHFNLVIGCSAILIEKMLRKDEFEKKCLQKIKEIIFKMLEVKKKEEIKDDYNDIFGYMINHNDGKILTAFMEYIRVYANFDGSMEDEVKLFFERELDKNDDYSQFIFCIFGAYLGIFYFADKDWVNDNFNKIFPLEKENLWLISTNIYFLHNNMHIEIYKKLLENRHFEKVIKLFNDGKFKNEEFVGQICVAYKYDIDDKTIFELLDTKNTKILVKIINFMNLYDNDNAEIQDKIFRLWDKIFNIFEKEKEIFNLYKWFKFVDTIDDNKFKQMKIIFDFMKYDVRYNFTQTMKIFSDIVNENNSQKIVELILYATEKVQIYITFELEKLYDLLEKVKEYGVNEEIIKRIKNLYDLHKYS